MFENMDFSKMGELLNQVQEKAKKYRTRTCKS